MRLQIPKLSAFVSKVEALYCFDPRVRNHFHSNVHAADVTQTTMSLICEPVLKHHLRSVDTFSLLVASALHDFRHPGVTNAFLVNSNDKVSENKVDDGMKRVEHTSIQRNDVELHIYCPFSSQQIALLFSDVSVLEHFHLSQAFLLMHSDKRYNFFDNMTSHDYKFIRRRIIQLVLATDLSSG